ncbi:glycoside hydrolase family 3 protein [Mucilaginibacter aquatilis]|uniref:beta-N-acetylhexosaminidase n=1 Tax=Mucilaginibacter aquatilis TaxID=1517760 RepID=A0A6I4I5P9_9SPHI|nr:glycoside hydrolase family 3 N-terminal domain-containing protein [Mucilaginibacter aquatilis]MVN90401.1 glycoside hydrolase family 3 [Mucilaginibacter aquatilis]
MIPKVRLIFTSLSLLLTGNVIAQQQQPDYISSLNASNHWVDSVFKKLNRKHKVSQLFFIRAHTNKGKAYSDSVARVIKKEQPGGIVFFQGGPVRQAALTNEYQKLSPIPLLVAMDGEWGLGMRLDSTTSYPYQMTLGAIQDEKLIKQMGREIAYDFKRLGLHINFAPVVDVNNNPNNPVINYRSFGDDKYKVSMRSIAYMQGMQEAGLLTSAKHFPGHGDTEVDSHYDLPLLNFNKQRLDSLEEYPFKQAIEAGISGVMVAHMSIPALDATKNLPSSLSKPIVTGLLRDSLGFKGLIYSDAMEMKGVVKYFPDGEADLRAFMAGNDVIELSQNSCRAIRKIKRAVRHGDIKEEELDAKVKKVLAAKYFAGLATYKPADLNNIPQDLNRDEAKNLVQQLSDASVTLLQDNVLQLYSPYQRTALISIGSGSKTVYQQQLAQTYLNNVQFNLEKNASAAQVNKLLSDVRGFTQIIIGVHDNRLRPQSKLDFGTDVKNGIVQLAAYPNSVLSVFANPYTLGTLPGIEKAGALLACYQKDDGMQRAATKVITRQITAAGRLPVTVNTFFINGSGITNARPAM